MLSEQEYVAKSLELHLFFARIMKEHSLFLEAGFTPKDTSFSQYADQLKSQFEDVLSQVVSLSNGVVSPNVLNSGEVITDFTLGTEEKTQNFTGIPIDKNITMMESKLYSLGNAYVTPQMTIDVRQINRNALVLLNNIIAFKIQILNSVLSCNMFTTNYPLLIRHILREAEMYRRQLLDIENGIINEANIKEMELFWDLQMKEHALFIRGLLDPTENALIETSDDFAKAYEKLLEETRAATDNMLSRVTASTLAETMKLKDFKTAGVKGISECKIQSIIIPLLADHVLREANHFIRILRT